MAHKSFARKRQSDIFLGDIQGEKSTIPISFEKLKQKARQQLSLEAYAYIAGSAGSETTKSNNRSGFKRWKIVPRMLRDVSTCKTDITLFNYKYPVSFLLAPIGVLEMAHTESDIAVSKAAAAEQVHYILSSQASVLMERCSSVMNNAPRWFQLYWSTSNKLVKSFVKRAENCNCETIVLTIDTTMLGWLSYNQ